MGGLFFYFDCICLVIVLYDLTSGLGTIFLISPKGLFGNRPLDGTVLTLMHFFARRDSGVLFSLLWRVVQLWLLTCLRDGPSLPLHRPIIGPGPGTKDSAFPVPRTMEAVMGPWRRAAPQPPHLRHCSRRPRQLFNFHDGRVFLAASLILTGALRLLEPGSCTFLVIIKIGVQDCQ